MIQIYSFNPVTRQRLDGQSIKDHPWIIVHAPMPEIDKMGEACLKEKNRSKIIRQEVRV